MGNFLDNLYDVIFKPRAAMAAIAAEKKAGQGAVVVLAGVVIPAWALYFGLDIPQIHKFAYFILALHIIGSLVLWIGGTAFFHLAAELLGGRGTAVGLLAAMGFSHLPRILVTPLIIFSAAVAGDYGPATAAAAGVIVMLWTFALDIFAVKGAYGISGARAVLVIFSPILLLIILAVIIAIFAGTAVLDNLNFWP